MCNLLPFKKLYNRNCRHIIGKLQVFLESSVVKWLILNSKDWNQHCWAVSWLFPLVQLQLQQPPLFLPRQQLLQQTTMITMQNSFSTLSISTMQTCAATLQAAASHGEATAIWAIRSKAVSTMPATTLCSVSLRATPHLLLDGLTMSSGTLSTRQVRQITSKW